MDRFSTERIILPGLFLGLGALLHLLAGPLIRRRVPPNRGYGLRVPATFSDESVWYDANEASGRDMRQVARICAVLTAVGFLAPIPDGIFGLVLASASVVALLTVAVVGTRRANRMLRARRAG